MVELYGEEIDLMSANDELDLYKREHRGPVDDWVGLYTSPLTRVRGTPKR
jgi:hypothetical protein